MTTDLRALRNTAVKKILRREDMGYLLRHALGKEWVDSNDQPNLAWTDFKRLYINTEYMDTQLRGAVATAGGGGLPFLSGDHTTAYLVAVCHEMLHNLWMHNVRAEGKLKTAWREACEYAINTYLAQVFQTKRWVHHLEVMFPNADLVNLARQTRYGLTTMGFYEALISNPHLRKIQEHKICCNFCDRKPDADAEPASFKDLVNTYNRLPKEDQERSDILEYLASRATQPQKMPWEMLLLGGIEQAVNQEQSWSVPSRRNDLLPGWRHEKLLSFVWVLDVSPSIDDGMKRSFMDTVQAGINLYHDAAHRIIFFAEGVVDDIIVSSGTNLSQMDIPIGYGTDLNEVWEILERDRPEHALVLTDLELGGVPKPTYTKIVWGIVGNQMCFDPDYGIKIFLK